MTTNDANQISLLAHLAYKFGGQTETIATEALGYILSRSEAARNALRDMIGIGGVDVGQIARAQTEGPDRGRWEGGAGRPRRLRHDGRGTRSP